jgi:protein-disulfide isomerase
MRRYLQGRNAVFVGAGIAAVAIAVALILVSVLGSSGDTKASPAPRTTTTAAGTATGSETPALAKAPGAAATVALFKGIPQTLNVLGDPNAPTTMIEFADLQCPFCREYAVAALPALVEEYVRTGKTKFVFSGMHFLGPDSEKALRAVFAAGIQDHAWEFLDLLYKSQGGENQGWVTDDLLRSIGRSIPGFDTARMLADMSSPEVDNAVAVADQQAGAARVNSTPTFFAGRTGGTLQQINVGGLTADAFRPTLDALTR